MSIKNSVSSTLLILGLLHAGATNATAQFGGLDEFKAKNEVRAQKLRREVNDVLSTSRKLITTNPVKARDMLRDVLQRLEDDNTLPESERRALAQRVRSTLQVVIPYARAQLQRQGQGGTPTGNKYYYKSTTKGPGNTPKSSSKYDIANKAFKAGRSNIYDNMTQKQLSESANRRLFLELNRSASSLVEKRITNRFVMLSSKRAKPKLTEKEALLLKVLNSTLSVDFPEGTTFKDALHVIQLKTGQPIIVDKASMREAMIQYDDGVSFSIKKATVRTILRKLLGDVGLTYVVVEGTLQAVTHQRARDMMVVHTYQVDDLLGTDPLIDRYYGPFVGDAVRARNAQFLITTIQRSVDPAIWDTNGGRATISYSPAARSLIVRAPAEVHYMLK